jgi:Stress responsive A/B Barrel Domain
VIAHVVLFSPKPDLAEADRRAIIEALVAAAGDIPSIKRFRVGKRVKHWMPGYEQLMRDDYEFAAIVEFDDIEALKVYLAHPSHATIGQHFTSSASKAIAYDYEIVDAADAVDLVG